MSNVKRMLKRRKRDDEFDPERFTGKQTMHSRLGDIGYFFQLQFNEAKYLVGRTFQICKDMFDEVFSRLRL